MPDMAGEESVSAIDGKYLQISLLIWERNHRLGIVSIGSTMISDTNQAIAAGQQMLNRRVIAVVNEPTE
jgi:hypothetical protein